jgi:hypothetical protein
MKEKLALAAFVGQQQHAQGRLMSRAARLGLGHAPAGGRLSGFGAALGALDRTQFAE